MKNQNILVSKRDGSKEPINLEKIHRVITWASEGLENVSVSEVELRSHIQFYDGITTSDIHETIVKSAADLISENAPDYQHLSARLAIFHLRKKAFDRFTPPALFEHINKMVSSGHYDKQIVSDYTKQDIDELDRYLDHDRDLTFSYAAVKQLEGKYLVQNRVTGKIYESPQFIYMLIPMCLFAHYPVENRLQYVKDFYDASSLFKLSLPTPIMSGVRTPTRQFSSCVLIESGDSLDSINATSSAIVKYVSQRAGIGVNIGRIRALGSEIRGGAATLFYPLWHLEVESLIVLKNNRGVEENRARHLDYGVQFNKMMYQRMIEGGDITLFSPSDVPGLYDAFFEDQVEFERLYKIYEVDDSIRKKKVKAIDLFTIVAQERAQTGRIYIQNVDHCNTHSPFDPSKAPVRQSNLCLEIALPTAPMNSIDDPAGEIALCTLSAFNLGAIENLEELESLSNLVVRALDSLLDYQDYPVEAARRSSMGRRTLGVGVTNMAYYLAKNHVKYSDGSANGLMHRTFEAIQFNLLKASNNLAKEQGVCGYYEDTNYAKGILPIDTYKKELDEVCSEPLHLDWEGLREEIKKHGLRNSTLTALMPCETSSQITNSTNGIEPPRGYVSVKASKDGILKQVVPGFKELRDQYELLWHIPNNKGYIQLVGIMQKFVDQAISSNTNYDPARFNEDKVPMKLVLQDLLYAYKMGLKTLYYHNTRDGASDSQEDDGCAGGACKL